MAESDKIKGRLSIDLTIILTKIDVIQRLSNMDTVRANTTVLVNDMDALAQTIQKNERQKYPQPLADQIAGKLKIESDNVRQRIVAPNATINDVPGALKYMERLRDRLQPMPDRAANYIIAEEQKQGAQPAQPATPAPGPGTSGAQPGTTPQQPAAQPGPQQASPQQRPAGSIGGKAPAPRATKVDLKTPILRVFEVAAAGVCGFALVNLVGQSVGPLGSFFGYAGWAIPAPAAIWGTLGISALFAKGVWELGPKAAFGSLGAGLLMLGAASTIPQNQPVKAPDNSPTPAISTTTAPVAAPVTPAPAAATKPSTVSIPAASAIAAPVAISVESLPNCAIQPTNAALFVRQSPALGVTAYVSPAVPIALLAAPGGNAVCQIETADAATRTLVEKNGYMGVTYLQNGKTVSGWLSKVDDERLMTAQAELTQVSNDLQTAASDNLKRDLHGKTKVVNNSYATLLDDTAVFGDSSPQHRAFTLLKNTMVHVESCAAPFCAVSFLTYGSDGQVTTQSGYVPVGAVGPLPRAQQNNTQTVYATAPAFTPGG
ncbi:MAG: hypothetical protein P4M15_04115 [Alphaproteobacteria bacterium]|nr:hypothetical protein [Alphaproteobacteria bacterium]